VTHPLIPQTILLAYPLYLLMMAGVMRICGVPKPDVAKWVLHQAGRQRFLDPLRAARGLPELPGCAFLEAG
jgi:hypothetical protein